MRCSPSSESTTAHRKEGVLAHPRGASQLRDSAGFTPDFASHTAPGRTREPQGSADCTPEGLDRRAEGWLLEAGSFLLVKPVLNTVVVVAAAAVAVAIVASRRPSRPPAPPGSWQPVEPADR